MNSTTNIVISVFFFITSSAIAQQGDHVSRQMDPDLLTRLRAEAWSHDIKNKIDNSIPPTIHMSAESRMEKVANNTHILSFLSALNRKPELLGQLELVGEQPDEIKRILQAYQDLNEKLVKRIAGVSPAIKRAYENEYQNDCRELTKELSEILISFQADALLSSKVGSGGLLEVLTKSTLASQYIDLSDAQKERLKKKQAELGREVQDFIREKRQESSRIFEQELNRQQRARLVEFFGADKLSILFEHSDSGTLIRHSGLGLSTVDQFGPELKTWRKIEQVARDKK